MLKVSSIVKPKPKKAARPFFLKREEDGFASLFLPQPKATEFPRVEEIFCCMWDLNPGPSFFCAFLPVLPSTLTPLTTRVACHLVNSFHIKNYLLLKHMPFGSRPKAQKKGPWPFFRKKGRSRPSFFCGIALSMKTFPPTTLPELPRGAIF
jgi:hypothetical protein